MIKFNEKEMTRLQLLCGYNIYCCGSCRNDFLHDDTSWRRIDSITATNILGLTFCPRCGERNHEVFVREFRCTSQDCPHCFSSAQENTPMCCVESKKMLPHASFCPICGMDMKIVDPNLLLKAWHDRVILKCCIVNFRDNPESDECPECHRHFPVEELSGESVG